MSMLIHLTLKSSLTCANWADVNQPWYLKPTDTVASVRREINKKNYFFFYGSVDTMMYKNRVLEDSRTLKSYRVKEGDSVNCYITIQESPRPRNRSTLVSPTENKVATTPGKCKRRSMSKYSESKKHGGDVQASTSSTVKPSRKRHSLPIKPTTDQSKQSTELAPPPVKRVTRSSKTKACAPHIPTTTTEPQLVPLITDEVIKLKKKVESLQKNLTAQKKTFKRELKYKILEHTTEKKKLLCELDGLRSNNMRKTKLETELADLRNNVRQKMEGEFQCSVCSELFVQATTLNCSHTFCEYCLCAWMKEKQQCPVCRTLIIDKVHVRALDNYIDRMIDDKDAQTKRKQLKTERAEKVKELKKTRRQRAMANGSAVSNNNPRFSNLLENLTEMANLLNDQSEDEYAHDPTWSSDVLDEDGSFDDGSDWLEPLSDLTDLSDDSDTDSSDDNDD